MAFFHNRLRSRQRVGHQTHDRLHAATMSNSNVDQGAGVVIHIDDDLSDESVRYEHPSAKQH